MSEKLRLKIVGCIGEIGVHQNRGSLKVDHSNHADSDYEVYITYESSCKVFYCKFATNTALSCEEQNTNKNSIRITNFNVLLWKSLLFPLNVIDLFPSGKSLWAVGDDCLVDVKSQIENAVQSSESSKKDYNEDFMEIDANDEFYLQEFESFLTIPSPEKHKLPKESICLKCNLHDNSIITCSKDLKTRSWNLSMLIYCPKSKKIKSFSLPDLPLSYDEHALNMLSEVTNGNSSKPMITFLHRRERFQDPIECQNNILHKLLHTDSKSDSVCIIGHPDGNVLYFLCSKLTKNKKFEVNSQMEQLFDMKQPIAGIHFLEKIKGVEGNGFLVIVGMFGKLVFITADQCFSNSETITLKNRSVQATALTMPTSIQKHSVYQNYIFHVSTNGDLWHSAFSKETGNNRQMKNLSFCHQAVINRGIADILLLNELKGLFLLVTASGNLYLAEYAEEADQVENSYSLPSLMNEIMQQSSVLKNLTFTASHQHKFFSALSTFASIKFSGTGKFNISCSVTELDELSKKFLVTINIKSSEKFDPEFWFVTASLYSHFQKDSAMITKTYTFILGQSLHIEVLESLLCMNHVSPFPIHIEVGLLLVLPEKLKTMPCFELVSKQLPLYVRVQTLILNELYFIKSKTTSHQSSADLVSSKSVLSTIRRLSLSKPISKLFSIERQLSSSHHQFSFCLLTTSAQKIVDCNSSGSPLAGTIYNLLLKNSNFQPESADGQLACRNQAMSLLVSAHDNSVSITLHADSFLLLAGLRMATMEVLLSKQKKLTSKASQYVRIPAALNKKCEKFSKELRILLEEDSEAKDLLEKIQFIYHNLRKEVSCVLPFC